MLLEGMEEAVPAGEPQRGQKCRQHCQEVSRQLHLKNTNRRAGVWEGQIQQSKPLD